MLDLLAFKATDLPVTNQAINGNFKDNDGFLANGYSKNAEDVSAIIEEDNQLVQRIEKNSENTRIIFNSRYAQGDKDDEIYVSLYIKTNMNVSNKIQLYRGEMNDTFSLDKERWEFLSSVGVRTSPNNVSGYTNVYVTGGTDDEAQTPYAMFKNHNVVNLTKTFGKGEEPTKNQMDDLIKQFENNYINGTENVFNAETLMKLYFKETKELRNAIISLGGELP